MPIRPENRDRYPPDWPEIRGRIRARANDYCEWCGVSNGAFGWRDPQGRFHELSMARYSWSWIDEDRYRRGRTFKIVCTVAHLNHRPEDCRPENLRLLCQRCHNRYDARHRAATRARVRDEKNGQVMLLGREM